MPLAIVDFSNFAVRTPDELLPEESNCKTRKPINETIHRKSPPAGDFCGLSLSNCELVALNGLRTLVDAAIFRPDKLVYLDLSQNRIEDLKGLNSFAGLKILYLHGNMIQSVENLKFLSEFTQLQTLTVHGNPLV